MHHGFKTPSTQLQKILHVHTDKPVELAYPHVKCIWWTNLRLILSGPKRILNEVSMVQNIMFTQNTIYGIYFK